MGGGGKDQGTNEGKPDKGNTRQTRCSPRLVREANTPAENCKTDKL